MSITYGSYITGYCPPIEQKLVAKHEVKVKRLARMELAFTKSFIDGLSAILYMQLFIDVMDMLPHGTH